MSPSSEQQDSESLAANPAPKSRLAVFGPICIVIIVLVGAGVAVAWNIGLLPISSATTTSASSGFFTPMWTSLSSVGSSSAYYALKNGQAYCSNGKLVEADASAMVVASTTAYAKDKNNVYFDCTLIQRADPASFELSLIDGWDYSKDRNRIYYDGSAITGADLATFELTGASSSDYAKDIDNVYYDGAAIPGADPSTFTVALASDDSGGIGYAKDKNNVYYNGAVVPHADPKTFEAIGYGLIAGVEPYGKDTNHVYQANQIFYDADPITFTLLNGYAKDKSAVYCDSGPIDQADPATFSVILALNDKISGDYAFRYAKDKSYVYSACSAVPYVDPNTFKLLFNAGGLFTGFAEDKNGVYFGSDLIPVSSSTSSFVVLTGSFEGTYWYPPYYAKDNDHVYDGDAILSGADPATFVDLTGLTGSTTPYAKDKNFVYYADPQDDPAADPGGAIHGANPNSIVALGYDACGYDSYAKDDAHVYVNGAILSGADPNTLTLLSTTAADPSGNTYDATDKNHYYYCGVAVQ